MKLIELIRNIFTEKKLEKKQREIKKVKLILNPVAGEGQVKYTLTKIRKLLNQKYPQLRLKTFLSGDEGEALLAAKEAVLQDYDMVIVAGGDGTITEVVTGLANTDIVLGIIPLGTGNVFAQEIGIPLDIDKACELLSTGKVKRVDLGKINNHYFLWIAGVGLDAYIGKKVPSSAKDAFGTFAFFVYAFKQIGKLRAPHNMKIMIDDEKEINTKALAVIIGNAASYDGHNISVKSIDSIADGYLDVCICKKLTFIWILRGIIWFLSGRRAYYRDLKYLNVEYHKVKKIRIEADPPCLVHIGGEIIGETPIECEVIPQALSIILPLSEQ